VIIQWCKICYFLLAISFPWNYHSWACCFGLHPRVFIVYCGLIIDLCFIRPTILISIEKLFVFSFCLITLFFSIFTFILSNILEFGYLLINFHFLSSISYIWWKTVVLNLVLWVHYRITKTIAPTIGNSIVDTYWPVR